MMRRPAGGMRWIHWAVGLSIALNLFFAAFIGAQAWRNRHPEGIFTVATTGILARGAIGEGVLKQLMSQLPADDGRILQDALGPKLPEVMAWQRHLAEAMERVRADIAQQPFDKDRLRADLLAAREVRQTISPLIEEVLLDALPRMSDRGRIVLSQYRLLARR